MFNRAERNGKALSLLIVWMMALGSLVALLAAVTPAAQAGTCDQVGGVITGDWTITTVQVCTGILYTVDGTITVQNGGSLTLIDGGLSFAKDAAHTTYSLNVNAGGTLILDNSIVTTETYAIQPYLKLTLTVGGTFVMQNHAVLKFPGAFDANGATLNITDSKITGFATEDLDPLGLGDDDDDAPVMAWTSTVADIYQSTIEKLYEFTGGAGQALSLSGGSSAYIYDSYVGVDYSNDPGLHNDLTVDATSNAYLYNVTIDRSQDPASLSNWQPAYRPVAAGGTIWLLRWLHASTVDPSGFPVAGATIWSRLSPGAQTAQYPDNGMGLTPSSRTLWYLGRAGSGANAWNRTDLNGQATIPLYTDYVTTATLPNAESFGNYQETATYSTYAASGGAFFEPYPNITAQNNNKYVTIVFNTAQACPSGVITWNTPSTFTGTVSVSKSLEVATEISISDGGLYVDQQQNGCAYVNILSGGSLTLTNASVWSNFALYFYVADGGSLMLGTGSSLSLTQRGVPGLFRSDGPTSSVTISDSRLDTNVSLAGGSASLVRSALLGPSLYLKTSSKTNLWDADLTGVTNLAFATDDGNPATVDFDIRNTTFDQVQTSQLVFGGSQNVQLTSVQLYDPSGTWWSGMITGNAQVSRYWWLTIRAVDGTGTLLANANVNLTLYRRDPVTLARVPVADPAVGDIYYTNDLTWPIVAPTGLVLYRAFAETRTASPSGRVVDNSYIANETAWLGGTFYPDSEAAGDVAVNTTFVLKFSSLTPDLSVTQLRVSGGNGPDSLIQPINTPLTLIATIRNTGQIDVRNVAVEFFADNVDKNVDGIMDFAVVDFEASAGIPGGRVVLPLVPKMGTATASVVWTSNGAVESSQPVSVVVDPPLSGVNDGGAIRETDETNDILPRTLTLFVWPDLSVGPADIQPVDAVVDNIVPLRITVHNEGTTRALSALLTVYDDGVPLPNTATFDLNNAGAVTLTINWRPTSIGNHNVMVVVDAGNTSIRNMDYIYSNNVATIVQNVKTQPDLAIVGSELSPVGLVPQGQSFSVVIPLHNLGQTTAQNISVAVYLDPALPGSRGSELGRKAGLTIGAGRVYNATVSLMGINIAGVHTLLAYADPDNNLTEGGAAQESNNYATFSVTITPPQGSVVIQSPSNGSKYQPGDSIDVRGFVKDNNGVPIAGVTIDIQLRNAQGPIGDPISMATDDTGLFQAPLTVPQVENGAYTLSVGVQGGQIQESTASITVEKIEPFLNQKVPLIGLPWWLFLVILAAVAGIVIGVTLYWKFYGLGKMVECGECGAFIPEDATTCPKCGVEFEKDMAKCSNCQAWIPVEVKRCPECGVEFATGEVEMADYQEKMRLQYDDVVTKFKEEASRQLGRVLSDREFQEWWRKQPTFVTFEDWLREEEEMRKMGSKPCPICGTLNSVTATVCHKCGSLMKQEPRPPSGGGGGGGAPVPVVRPRAATPAAPAQPPEEPFGGAQGAPGGMQAGTDTIPRRVIRKPVATQPVVQKKVIKRPMGEGGQQGESTESQSASENPEDEL